MYIFWPIIFDFLEAVSFIKKIWKSRSNLILTGSEPFRYSRTLKKPKWLKTCQEVTFDLFFIIILKKVGSKLCQERSFLDFLFFRNKNWIDRNSSEFRGKFTVWKMWVVVLRWFSFSCLICAVLFLWPFDTKTTLDAKPPYLEMKLIFFFSF